MALAPATTCGTSRIIIYVRTAMRVRTITKILYIQYSIYMLVRQYIGRFQLHSIELTIKLSQPKIFVGFSCTALS
jgi:hypothetical protein